MTANETGYLILVVFALVLFGGVLGWASWEETRSRRRKGR